MFIESRGGRDNVLKSERLLLELINQRSRANSSSVDTRWAHRQSTLDLRALKEELSEELDISISRNLAAFERKFEMQQKELERTQETFHDSLENQPTIKSASSGPHDKIRDNVSVCWHVLDAETLHGDATTIGLAQHLERDGK